jgi:hypothetical protein
MSVTSQLTTEGKSILKGRLEDCFVKEKPKTPTSPKMFRPTAGIIRRGVRQMSIASPKQDMNKIREKWDISHKWVFLRKRGTDDLVFAFSSLLGVTIFVSVLDAYYHMLSGDKVVKA